VSVSVSEAFTEKLRWKSNNIDSSQVEAVLHQQHLDIHDLPILLSATAAKYLPQMAERSHRQTLQRFGANLQLFLPLYLSNLCTNICTYCGFSADAPIKRTWLRPHQLEDEVESLKQKNVEHLLLVTGEAEHKIGLEYFCKTLQELRPHFANLLLESQPFSEQEYRELAQAGLDGVVVYQETYNKNVYSSVHKRGKKQDFSWRLNTPERIAKAGIDKIGMGILLGLADWREDALALAEHLHSMQKKYWQQRYSISFPRLRPCASAFDIPCPVTDREFIQLVVAFRLCFPDVELVLSTRESATMRNALLPLGITHLSAEASTQPGGYSENSAKALKQFDISDERSLAEIQSVIEGLGYMPVLADQIPVRSL